MTTQPTIAVFDLGNVVITWDRASLYRRLIPDPDELQWFLDNILTLDENAALDRGVPLAEMTADLARRHPDHAELIDAFRTRWIETCGPTVPGTVDLLVELRQAQVPLYALSNWGRDTFEQSSPDFEWLGLFDGVVISGREGVIKPDPAIFELLCRRYGFEPADAVFIDDSATNVAAAADLGFATVHFSDAADLRHRLRALGLL